jgi:hypothetical protein
MLGDFGSRFNNRLIIGRPDSRKQGEELGPLVQCEFMKGFEWRNFRSLGFFGVRPVPHDGVKRVAGASGLREVKPTASCRPLEDDRRRSGSIEKKRGQPIRAFVQQKKTLPSDSLKPVDYAHAIRRAEVDRGCAWGLTWEGSLDALRTVPRAVRVEHLEARCSGCRAGESARGDLSGRPLSLALSCDRWSEAKCWKWKAENRNGTTGLRDH